MNRPPSPKSAKFASRNAIVCGVIWSALGAGGLGSRAFAQPDDAENDPNAPIELEAPLADPDAAPRKSDDKDRKPPARIAAGGRILAQARSTLKAKGCAEAAPAYRVAAAMGDGFEAAQHELGDCLLTMEGRTASETELFRQEGMLWLTRAAFAGNARAQYRLAILHASPIAGAHDPGSALKWSLAYTRNPESDLYGQGPLPKTMVPGLKKDLPPAEVTAAEAFAEEFVALPLEAYEPARDGKGKDKSFDERREEFERKRRERGGGQRGGQRGRQR